MVFHGVKSNPIETKPAMVSASLQEILMRVSHGAELF